MRHHEPAFLIEFLTCRIESKMFLRFFFLPQFLFWNIKQEDNWLISCPEIVFGKSGRKKQNEFLLILSDYENKQYTMRRLFCLFVIFLHLGRIAIIILLPKTRNLEDGQ